MDFTNTPLAEPVPDDPIERVHRFARDLAWGVNRELWKASFESEFLSTWNENSWQYAQEIWGATEEKLGYPSFDMLQAFGYIVISTKYISATGTRPMFPGGEYKTSAISLMILTEKAFSLLQKPFQSPTVFISYRRKVSSALGLLLVARLKMVGVSNPFIDMNIQPGDDWRAHLEQIVRGSRYFILLVGEGTLESEYIQQEIGWALSTPNAVIIPVLHDELRQDVLPPELGSKQAVVVERESAEYYELAVVKVLNRLGYTP